MHAFILSKQQQFLQSVSANFTRSSSELYSEIDKWAGNFVITFRNSEAISELRFEMACCKTWTGPDWTGLEKHGLSPGFVKHGLSP